jgi:hypothetical protein
MTYRKHKPRKPKKVWENVFDEKLQKYVVRRIKPDSKTLTENKHNEA